MLLDDNEYYDLKRRFRSGEFPEELDALLRRLVPAVVYGSRLSQRLAPGEVWNEASVEDALHGWYEKRLLIGGLASAFDQADSARHFLNRLEISFRHHLANQRERSESGNLFRRTGQLLTSEPEFRDWFPESNSRGAWWGLTEWNDPDPYQGSDEDLARKAWRTGEFDLFRYGATSQRLDPVLRTEELKRFLVALLNQASGLLTRTHLAIALERRFNLDGFREVPLEDSTAEAIAPPDDEPDEEALLEAAAAVLAEISMRQAEVVFRRFRGGKLAAIAEAMRVSTSTADNEVKRVVRIIERHASHKASSPRIMEKLIDLLSIETDDK
jgi:hypothetical protein